MQVYSPRARRGAQSRIATPSNCAEAPVTAARQRNVATYTGSSLLVSCTLPEGLQGQQGCRQWGTCELTSHGLPNLKEGRRAVTL